MRAGGADVSLRDVTMAQMGNGARECGWRHAPEACGGFWRFWKKLVSWVLPREKTVGFRLLAEARPVALWRVPHVLGGGTDGKASIERLCISLPNVETFYSKVIKGFVPELRSRYVFLVFQYSYVLCIYVMNILCTFHVAVSGYVTKCYSPTCFISLALLVLRLKLVLLLTDVLSELSLSFSFCFFFLSAVLEKHGVLHSSAIPEVTWYDPLYYNKTEFKGIPVISLLSLIPLHLRQTKRIQPVNGVRRKEVSLQTSSEWPNKTQNSPLLRQTFYMPHKY